jgi:hypothetical protein
MEKYFGEFRTERVPAGKIADPPRARFVKYSIVSWIWNLNLILFYFLGFFENLVIMLFKSLITL